jgi:hypothetical protein
MSNVTRAARFAAAAFAAMGCSFAFSVAAFADDAAPSSKPNILVIIADDIGYWNINAYNRGMMGCRRVGTAYPSMTVGSAK